MTRPEVVMTPNPMVFRILIYRNLLIHIYGKLRLQSWRFTTTISLEPPTGSTLSRLHSSAQHHTYILPPTSRDVHINPVKPLYFPSISRDPCKVT